eukprot:403351337
MNTHQFQQKIGNITAHELPISEMFYPKQQSIQVNKNLIETFKKKKTGAQDRSISTTKRQQSQRKNILNQQQYIDLIYNNSTISDAYNLSEVSNHLNRLNSQQQTIYQQNQSKNLEMSPHPYQENRNQSSSNYQTIQQNDNKNFSNHLNTSGNIIIQGNNRQQQQQKYDQNLLAQQFNTISVGKGTSQGKRSMSNTRGITSTMPGLNGPYMNSRVKQQQQQTTLELNFNNNSKKARSKSRRINPHKTLETGLDSYNQFETNRQTQMRMALASKLGYTSNKHNDSYQQSMPGERYTEAIQQIAIKNPQSQISISRSKGRPSILKDCDSNKIQVTSQVKPQSSSNQRSKLEIDKISQRYNLKKPIIDQQSNNNTYQLDDLNSSNINGPTNLIKINSTQQQQKNQNQFKISGEATVESANQDQVKLYQTISTISDQANIGTINSRQSQGSRLKKTRNNFVPGYESSLINNKNMTSQHAYNSFIQNQNGHSSLSQEKLIIDQQQTIIQDESIYSVGAYKGIDQDDQRLHHDISLIDQSPNINKKHLEPIRGKILNDSSNVIQGFGESKNERSQIFFNPNNQNFLSGHNMIQKNFNIKPIANSKRAKSTLRNFTKQSNQSKKSTQSGSNKIQNNASSTGRPDKVITLSQNQIDRSNLIQSKLEILRPQSQLNNNSHVKQSQITVGSFNNSVNQQFQQQQKSKYDYNDLLMNQTMQQLSGKNNSQSVNHTQKINLNHSSQSGSQVQQIMQKGVSGNRQEEGLNLSAQIYQSNIGQNSHQNNTAFSINSANNKIHLSNTQQIQNGINDNNLHHDLSFDDYNSNQNEISQIMNGTQNHLTLNHTHSDNTQILKSYGNLTDTSGTSQIKKISKFGKLSQAVASFANRDHLSKSIIVHHATKKTQNNMLSRYNDDLFIQDLNGDDEDCQENAQNQSAYGFLIEKDHEVDYEMRVANQANDILKTQESPVKSVILNKNGNIRDHSTSQISGQTEATSFYNQIQSKNFVPISSAAKNFSYQSNLIGNNSKHNQIRDDKSSLMHLDLYSTSFDNTNTLDRTQENQSYAQQRKTIMSGSNALLSLLSQDDFTKLKQDIHNHIDKIGGQIDEIAASEEDDENAQSNRQKQQQKLDRQKANLTNNFMDITGSDNGNIIDDVSDLNANDDSGNDRQITEEMAPLDDDDDDDVILTSYRGYNKNEEKMRRKGKQDNKLNKGESKNSNEQDFDSYRGMEESPRQNTKYIKT